MIAVLYASETGTAREVAYRVSEWLRRRVACDTPRPLDWEGGALLWESRVAVIVCATTGDGEAPRNMRSVWRRLVGTQCPRLDLRYALYGLGDARYGPKFNAAARRLDARLRQLGGLPLSKRVLADGCAPGGIVAPLPDFYAELATALGVEGGSDLPSSLDDLPQERYEVKIGGSSGGALETTSRAALGWDMNADIYEDCAVVENSRLTEAGWSQNVRHIVVSGDLAYGAGDVAHVLYENEAELVKRALRVARRAHPNLDAADRVELAPRVDAGRAPRPPLPRVATAAEIFSRYVDLTGPPGQLALARLRLFATDPEQATKLEELSTTGCALFDEYVVSERRSLLEILEDFDSVAPPLATLLDEFDWLKPRAFSIASAPSLDPNAPLAARLPSPRIELCVAVVEFRTKLGRKLSGACSSWLARLPPGRKLDVAITRGSFAIRDDTPFLLLVGPGTGVAPMRSIASRASARGRRVHTFFGCRHPTADRLYMNEPWQHPDVCTLACSRHPDPASRAYVTHKLRANADLVAAALLKSGTLLVAGNVRMTTDVRAVVLAILEDRCRGDAKQARAILSALERDGRFAVEAYG